MHRLILFDIDGTILSSGGAAPRAFRDALLEIFGTTGPIERHSFAGKTDPQIARELLSAVGIDDAALDAGLPALWRSYVEKLERELEDAQITVLPGVLPLLARLETMRERALLGLLTGNLREGARLKLNAAQVHFERFQVGAFGSDHADRPELPAIAVERAEERVGHRFEGKSIVIIGDTPADIACGERLGVRTIAVATGSYSEAQLAACAPDHVFSSLEDLDAVLRAIFG
jgi:phosphoglycolate phosphatase